MNRGFFRHIGGAVIADHGLVTLAQARRLAAFYACQADFETGRTSDECLHRAQALESAVAAAMTWRRASGWKDPDLADVRRALEQRPGGDLP
jgi:hypothetical protein